MGIYYTIQGINAWIEAQNQGYLVGNKEYVCEDFIRPYQWMMKQMQKRIPDYNGEYPIWLWPDKQDLRRRGYNERGMIRNRNPRKPGIIIRLSSMALCFK